MASKKDPKEFTIPMALITLSVIIYAGGGLAGGGADGAMETIVAIGLSMIVGVVFGIIGFYVATWLFGIEYGNLITAMPKMGAIVLFPGSIAQFIPGWPGWLVSLILYFFLLSWLFALDATDTFITVLTLFVLQILAGILIGFILFSSTW